MTHRGPFQSLPCCDSVIERLMFHRYQLPPLTGKLELRWKTFRWVLPSRGSLHSDRERYLPCLLLFDQFVPARLSHSLPARARIKRPGPCQWCGRDEHVSREQVSRYGGGKMQSWRRSKLMEGVWGGTGAWFAWGQEGGDAREG